MSLFCALAWLRLLYSTSVAIPILHPSIYCLTCRKRQEKGALSRLSPGLRGESWLGPRLLPILAALKDTFAFFLVTAICLLAATHAYYNLQVRYEPSPVYAAFMQVMRLGSLDLLESRIEA